jgi:hypothetical protein
MTRKQEVNDADRFPPELLEQPKEERLKYFIEYAVEHPVLKGAFSTLLEVLIESTGKPLILVIGPPGAGKTFLRLAVMAEIQDLWSQKQIEDPGRIPIVGIEVPAKDRIKPSWDQVYKRILIEMEEPLIDKKITHGDITIYRDSNGKVIIPKADNGKLRYSVEQALIFRDPYGLFLDEAQHLLEMAGLSFQDQMDCIKSIASMGRTLLVLFGTYEMLDLLDLSDQLMRRSSVIHLRRYGFTKSDKDTFRNTLHSFQVNLPFPEEPDLLPHTDYFHERTAGCIGILYDWLLAAYKLALKDSSASTLPEEYIEKTCPLSERRAEKMNDNITTDEQRLKNEIGGEDTYFKKWRVASQGNDRDTVTSKKDAQSPSGQKKTTKPFNRKPGRDQTGRRSDRVTTN